jgi:hypothetical protein
MNAGNWFFRELLVRMIKSRNVSWLGYVAQIGEIRKLQDFLARILQKKLFGTLGMSGRIKKVWVREMDCESVTRLELVSAQWWGNVKVVMNFEAQ